MVRQMKFRMLVVRKTPAGIAMSPFEVALLGGYLAAGVSLLLQVYTGHKDPTVKALPFMGWELSAWLWMLVAGAALALAGIVVQGARRVPPWRGLQAERLGLIVFGGALTTYVGGIIHLIGWQAANPTLASLALTLCAAVFKILQIGQAIETLEVAVNSGPQ
jgi:hypothetical protein